MCERGFERTDSYCVVAGLRTVKTKGLFAANSGYDRHGHIFLRGPTVQVVRLYQTVVQTDNSLGMCGDVVFVRDHNQRAAFSVQPVKQLQDFLRSARIEVARGLVGKDEVRIVNEAARDGHPLLLTTW